MKRDYYDQSTEVPIVPIGNPPAGNPIVPVKPSLFEYSNFLLVRRGKRHMYLALFN
jgi:hypothetical protein